MTSTGLDNNCTFAPDGIPEFIGGTAQEWTTCCLSHDIAYLMSLDRLTADIDLGFCLVDKGFAGTGVTFAIAVIVCGKPFYNKLKKKKTYGRT